MSPLITARPGRVLVAKPDERARDCGWDRPTKLLVANCWTLLAWMWSPKKLIPLTWRWCGSLLAGTDWVDRLNCVMRGSLTDTSSSGTATCERLKELWVVMDDWGRPMSGANDESTDTGGRRSSFCSVTACASHSDSIHSNLLLMLRWIASDWCLEGAERCNSNRSCSRSTICPSMSKFPRGFWVVKSVKACAARIVGQVKRMSLL